MKKKLFFLLFFFLLIAFLVFWGNEGQNKIKESEKKQEEKIKNIKDSKNRIVSSFQKKNPVSPKSVLEESLENFQKAKSEVLLLFEEVYDKETLENIPDGDSKAYYKNPQGFLEYLHPHGIVFILVPKGASLKKSFWLSKYELTQGQWQKIIGPNPAKSRLNLPVESISWKELEEFCKKTGFRIPSSQEWEYACLAGASTKFPWGKEFDKIGLYAWFNKNSKQNLQEIGKKAPNRFGFYDMLGNVAEWCLEEGKAKGSRIFRGGSYRKASLYCNPKYFQEASENTQIAYIGARVAMDREGKAHQIEKEIVSVAKNTVSSDHSHGISQKKNTLPKEVSLSPPSNLVIAEEKSIKKAEQPKKNFPEDKGKIFLEPSHWNIGNISQENILKTKIKIQNQTTKRVNLLEIHSGCGCVVGEPQSKSLEPGTDTFLDVSFHPKGRRGYQRQELRIFTDHEQNKMLTFLIEGSVLISSILSERQIRFGKFRQGTSFQRILKIAAKESKNIEIQSTIPYFTWNIKKTMVEGFYPGKQRGWEISLSPKENIPFGRHQGFLQITTDQEKHQIPVLAYVTGPIVASRNYISLGAINNKRKNISYELEIYSEEQHSFIIQTVTSPFDFISIEKKRLSPFRYALILKISNLQNLPKGEFRGTLKIETSHPSQPVIEIPIQGFVG